MIPNGCRILTLHGCMHIICIYKCMCSGKKGLGFETVGRPHSSTNLRIMSQASGKHAPTITRRWTTIGTEPHYQDILSNSCSLNMWHIGRFETWDTREFIKRLPSKCLLVEIPSSNQRGNSKSIIYRYLSHFNLHVVWGFSSHV